MDHSEVASKGGRARAKNLTKARRQEIARLGVQARLNLPKERRSQAARKAWRTKRAKHPEQARSRQA